MIITNKIDIGFRIPDDSIRLQQFEAQNDISHWVRRETTEYVTYSYVTVQLMEGYEDIVRCEDCIHSAEFEGINRTWCARNTGMWFETEKDGFCSKGKRRG